jgi:predicted RNA-binding Zn-ribbon protein involved in translation (DUF1610 family)
MPQIIHFKCRGCETELEVSPDAAESLVCPDCGNDGGLRLGSSFQAGSTIDTCAVCGHDSLYIQKDFNRALGLLIVVIGVGLSIYFFAGGRPVSAMLALVGMATLDTAIYLAVGEVAVCYACHAIYRGFDRNPQHEPFNLELLEKYGGRSPRW